MGVTAFGLPTEDEVTAFGLPVEKKLTAFGLPVEKSKSGIRQWTEPSIDLLTGEPIPQEAEPKYNPQVEQIRPLLGTSAKEQQLKQQQKYKSDLTKKPSTNILDYLVKTNKEVWQGLDEYHTQKLKENPNVFSALEAIPAKLLNAIAPASGKEFQENVAVFGAAGMLRQPIKAAEPAISEIYRRVQSLLAKKTPNLEKEVPKIIDTVIKETRGKMSETFIERSAVADRRSPLARVPNHIRKSIESGEFTLEQYKANPEYYDNLFNINKPAINITKEGKVTEIPRTRPMEETIEFKKEIPGVEQKRPKYAGSINLDRQNISEEAKKMELEIFQREGITKTISNKKTIAESNKIFRQLQDDPVFYNKKLELIRKGETPTVPEELAFRTLNAKNQTEFIEATKKLSKGEITPEDFKALENKVKDIQLNITDPLASDAGRRLQMYNIEVGKNKAFRAIAKLKKSMNERQVKELSELDFDNPDKVNEFVERLPDPKFRDYFYEYWYNSILSGIPTHVVNVATNTMWSAFQIPHRVVTAGIDAVISKFANSPREYFVSEIISMMAGIKPGFKQGSKAAIEAIKTGRSGQLSSKFDKEIGYTVASAFERSPHKALRRIAPAVSAPTRLLQGSDIMYKGIAFNMEAGALARRAALQKGLTGEAAQKFELEFLKNMPKDAMDEAMKFADYATFQDEPGKITQAITKIRDVIPGGRLILPFVRTIGNLMKRGVEMTPIVGMALARNQKPAEVIAKQIEGAVLTYLIAKKLDSGEITGALPENKAEREAWERQGKLPWAVKWRGQWVQYRRIEPFNTVVASVAEFYRNFIKNPEDKTIPEKFLNATKGVIMNLIDSGYLEGVQRILNKHGKWEGIVPKFLSSLVPYSGFWRSVNRSVESLEEEGVKVREAKDFLGTFSQVIPGLYGAKEPKLNVWGEEILVEGNFFRQWLPYKWAKETDDPVEKELNRLGFYPGLPGKKGEILDTKYELNDDEYKNYIKMSGKLGKQAIQQIIEMPKYESLPDEMKIKLIDSRFTGVRRISLKYAKANKIMTDEFINKFINKKQ